jgi:predicted aspartyl protease
VPVPLRWSLNFKDMLMGTFTTRIGIGNPMGGEFYLVDALVDTGASHSMVPATLLQQTLNLSPKEELLFVLGDGREQRYGFGAALMRVEEREMPCPVIFGPEDQYLLGATSLQAFNLIPDTTNHRLVAMRKLTI